MISIIVAIDEKRGIGKGNDLLFKIPEDFKRMTKIISGHPLVMGRKTWESLPAKPLPNHNNIIVTRDPEFKVNDSRKGKDFSIVSSLEAGISEAKESSGNEEIFIFGGGQIYKEALEKNLVDKLYLTIVEGDFNADTFFPDYSQFKKVIFEKSSESGGHKYKFIDLER